MTIDLIHPAAATKGSKTLLRVHHALQQFGFCFVFLEELVQDSTRRSSRTDPGISRYVSAFLRKISAASAGDM
jgi:hypothetical protein